MAGTRRPGRPKGSKNKPRVTSTSASNANNLSASSSLDTGRTASSKQPSDTPPVPPRSSLPPSVLASLERPSVTNYARNHPIFSGSEKVSEKKYLKEVKAFASAKNINEDFVTSCVGEAKRLLEERKTDSAAPAKDVGAAAARPDGDHGSEKKPKKHKKDSSEQDAATPVIKQEQLEEPVKEKKKKHKKDSSEQDTATPVIKQEQFEEPVKEKKKKHKKDSSEQDTSNPVIKQEQLEAPVKGKKKKHKKKDGLSASVSTQDFAVKQVSEEPVAEHERPKRHKKKHKSSESAALAHEEPATQAEDADGKKAKRHKKGKTSESAGESASAANLVSIKSEEPSTESKSPKTKRKSHAEAKSADVPERRPTETPIPLPTTGKSEEQKDPAKAISKSKPSKKRKRDQSDDGSSKPVPDEAEASDVGYVSKKRKKHGKSGHESDSRTTEGKKDKKKKHETHQASRSPSPPPRKKTKRVQHDGETTHLASEAPQPSRKSHEHADKGKGTKGKKTKELDTSEVSRPGPSKSAAPKLDTAPERSGDGRPTQIEGNALTSRSSKKKHKKERRKSKLSESLETQPAHPSDAMDIESGSEKPGADHEAQREKHSKKAKEKSAVAQEALAALPFAGAQDSPAKPSKTGPRQHDSESAKFLPPPPPPKRKRSPSPPSDEETRPRDTRKSSLASTTSVLSLPTLTRFANDSLVFPEPPEGMSSNAKRRWRKQFRKSMQKLPKEARPVIGSEVDASAPQKAPARAEAAKSDDESDSGKKPDRKKAKVEHDSDDRQHENDAASKMPAVLGKWQASTSQDTTIHRTALERPQVTTTGSFAREEPLSPISSSERLAPAHEQIQDSTSGHATVAEPITRKPHVNATRSLAHDKPLPKVPSPERPDSVRETPVPPATSDSPLNSVAQGWNALPAQYLSDSDQEARDASDVEPDTPIKATEPLQPQEAGDEDVDTESSKDPDSETESESDSESEAEEPFKPGALPPHLPKTPSQIFTPSKRPLPRPASLQAQPYLTLSQIKASTPTLAASTRAAVPFKPKTLPKANGNVDILGIPHGTDESDEESSGSSSSSDDDDGDRKTNVQANAVQPVSLPLSSSQSDRSFVKPKTPLQGHSVPAARKPSEAPETSTARMERPLADTLDSDAGSEDENDSGSASSDGNDNDREVAVSGKRTTPLQAQSSQETKVNRPEKPPSKRDEPGRDNLGMQLRPQESDDEASSQSESDGEENGTWASTNQNPVLNQSQRSQRIKLESPQSSSPASRSPQRGSTLLDPQADESTKEIAQVEKHSDQAESEDESEEHSKIKGANDTAVELRSVDGQPEETGQEHSRSSNGPGTENPPPFESALLTPAQHPSPAPRQKQLDDLASDAPRLPLANDVINGIALSGSKKANPVEQDGPQNERNSANSEAHELRVNHASAIDEGMKAETLADADGESLRSAEKSNHNYGSSTNLDEPDTPSVDTSTNSPSPFIKQSHSSPVSASIENDEPNMGQVISTAEFEDAHIPSRPPAVEIEGGGVSISTSRPLRSRSRRLHAMEQADALAESQRVVSTNSPSSPISNEAGQFRARERSVCSAESDGLVKANSPPRPLRNEAGKFCKKDGTTSKTERNRKPKTKTPRPKSNQFVLRELGIDPETTKADEAEGLNERSTIMTRGSQSSLAEESNESPMSTRWPRLRATPRVSYQDGYNSGESVTKTTARRLSFTSNKTKSHTRRPSSQRSRPSPSPRFDGNLPPKVKTPFKTRSEFVGVFIPIRRPGKSVTSLGFHDGKSAKQQVEDAMASTADADQANDEDLAREPVTPPSPSEGARDDNSAADDKSAHEDEAPQDHNTAEDTQDRDKEYESSPSVYQSPERPVFTASLWAHPAPKAVPTDSSTSENEGSDILRDNQYESSPSVYQSPERPVFTASLPAHPAPKAVPTDSSTSENEGSDILRDNQYESSPSVYQSPERPVFTASLPAHPAPRALSMDENSTSENEGSDHEGEVDDAESEATQSGSAQSGFARQGSPMHHRQDLGIDENEKDLVLSPEAKTESPAQDEDERQGDFQGNCQDESQEGSDEDKAFEAASRGSDYSFDDEPNGFVNEDGTVSGQATPRRSTGLRSNHFSPAKPFRPAAGVARLKFPSTMADAFGLIQEELSKDPLRLFVATMLLNRTNGEKAIPKFWEIMEKYPTVDDLPHANLSDLTEMIQPLGLQARRAESMIKLSRFFITNPPTMGLRYRVMNYPFKGAHRDIRPGEVLSDDDPRVAAFEVSHLPGVGPYAIDSWRIFCRDQLRGKSTGYNGEDAAPGFEPEWKRVHPNDKELKGFIRWMWLREGWIWDPVTGEKKKTSEDEALAARLARLRWDQKKGEAYILPGDDEEDQGSLSREEGNGFEGQSNENAQASQADSVPSSHVSSPADNPSSQLEREQRNRAAQSQLAQAQLLHEEQQQRLTMPQPRPSTASHIQRSHKANDPNGALSTAPATLPTRLRRTTTTTTTSTSSSPASAHRPKPTPLDLFSDDNGDSASNLGLRSLFRTPRRRRGSSAKWAASGVVDETPPVSPRRERQQQDRSGDKTAHNNDGEHDMDNFGVFGDDNDQYHDPQDTVKANGNGINGHREAGDDHGHDDNEGRRLAPAGLHEDKADAGRVEDHEEPERRCPPGVVNEPIAGDGSQESNKSCRVM